MSLALRLLAPALAGIVGLGSPPEVGAPAEGEPAVAPDAEGPSEADRAAMQRAGALFVEGQSAFDAKDFETAIARWTEALDALPQQPQYAATRNNIRLSVASAYVEHYDVGKNITDLRKADRQILEVLEDLDGADPTVREPVASEHRRVRALLEEAERTEFEKASVEREAANAGRRDAARAEEEAALAERQAERESGARIMLIAGAVSGVVSAGFFGGMTVSLVAGNAAEQEGDTASRRADVTPEELDRIRRAGEQANANAIALGVVGGIALIPAVALIAVGARNRRRPVDVAPTVSRGAGGVVVRGRF